MWIFTRYGFFSVACASKSDGSLDPDTLMVRPRRRDHLANLRKRFSTIRHAQIVTLPNRDYRYRLLVPKATWISIVSEAAAEQTWSNFKNETARFQGRTGAEYIHALHSVWSIMNDLQDEER